MRAIVLASSLVSAVGNPGVLPDEILGYYSWNWGAGSTGPHRANMGCSFTGYTDVDKAIAGYKEDASWCCPKLLGEKLLTLGGGNAAGRFTAHALSKITSKAHTIKAAGFKGVMYDVEEVVGPSSSMAGHFAKSFSAMRKAGLIVGVTTSHSAPYHCDSPHDAVHFVKAWCADPNVDIISPQLYSSGSESKPELASTSSCKSAGCTWELFKHCKAEIAPSIVRPSHYSAAKHFFATKVNRTTKGYFMWAQTKGDVVV
jgi:hypothetical protein